MAGTGTAQDVWNRLADADFESCLAQTTLMLTDREIVGCQRVLDGLGLDLNLGVRNRVPPVELVRLLIDQYMTSHKAVINDPMRRERSIVGWADGDWGMTVSEAVVLEALERPLSD